MLCEKLAELFCLFGKKEAITCSSDQFFFPNKDAEKNTQRRQLDALLDSMSDDGLEIVTATAQKVVEVEKKHEVAAQ